MSPTIRQMREGLISDAGKSSDTTLGIADTFGLRVKRAVVADLKESKWSREQVAERLSGLLDRRVTVAQIDAIAAESKENRLPAEWVPAWIQATGSRRVLEMLVAEAGGWLGDLQDRQMAELGRLTLRVEAIKTQLCNQQP